ncbi:MAG: hypothetical protein ABII93_05820 [Chrysiogenia bacterium]
MKKIFFLFMIFGLFLPGHSFFPYFYGARSLALGYSSLAFNYDYNAIYINPALLNSLRASLGGFQYQSSFLDFQDAAGQWAGISAYDLKNFQDLNAETKSLLIGKLDSIFAAKNGISGFQFNNPGYAGKGYALSLAKVDAAVIFPEANSILAKPPGAITNDDIISLQMRFIGFQYSDYSLAIAIPLGQGLAMGATAHYLKGRNAEFKASITETPFLPGANTKDFLHFAWSGAEKKFSKLNFDVGISADLGQYFKAGIMVKNVSNPVISTAFSELRLARRLVGGLALRPDSQLGIYLDIDVAKGDLYHNGQDAQPVSLGVEKGLFQNKLFLRAGFLSDLCDKYILGSKANVLYGLGFGFNLGNFLVDFALGLDHMGYMKNLAISGFYLLK